MIKKQNDSAINHRTKADLVFQTLREDILSGSLEPETRLTPSELSKRLGTSMVPIREALMRLEREGLVEVESYKRTRVARMSIADLVELFSVRAVLEGHAVRLAGANEGSRLADHLEQINERIERAAGRHDYAELSDANWEFHRFILRSARNYHLVRLLEDIWTKCSRYRAGFRLIEGRDKAVKVEHDRIIAAIRGGDGAEMERQCRAHILKAGDEMRLYLEAEELRQSGT